MSQNIQQNSEEKIIVIQSLMYYSMKYIFLNGASNIIKENICNQSLIMSKKITINDES